MGTRHSKGGNLTMEDVFSNIKTVDELLKLIEEDVATMESTKTDL